MSDTQEEPKGKKLVGYTVEVCNFSDIRKIFEESHYKSGAIGGGLTVCYALKRDGILVGGAAYGKPRHQHVYEGITLDLRRFAVLNDEPKNIESFFLGRTIREIKKAKLATKIVTFADSTFGHIGTIYKACNFKFVEMTEPSRAIRWNGKLYHRRSLSIDRPYSYALREAYAKGEAVMEKGGRKYKYIYDILDTNRSTGNK